MRVRSVHFAALFALSTTLALAACEGTTPAEPDPQPEPTVDGGGNEPEVDAPLEDMAPSTRNDLRWVRVRALENSLGAALRLTSSEICQELGRFSCTEKVHLVALGGNDPFELAQYEPQALPGTTTWPAFERLVTSACLAARDKEASAQTQFIFLDLPLNDTPLNLDDQAVQFAVDDTITSLYRKLHGRNPTDAERAIATELSRTADGAAATGNAFALQSCMAIASTTETLLQ